MQRGFVALKAMVLAVAALVLSACSTTQQSAPKAAVAEPEQTKAVLWVGNSFFYYNNSMHGHVGQLIRGSSMTDKAGHRAVSATISGSGINWHDLESHFKPNGVGSYSFNSKNEVVFIRNCARCFMSMQKRTATLRANTARVRRFSCRGRTLMRRK
jgi:hypothetical protein